MLIDIEMYSLTNMECAYFLHKAHKIAYRQGRKLSRKNETNYQAFPYCLCIYSRQHLRLARKSDGKTERDITDSIVNFAALHGKIG